MFLSACASGTRCGFEVETQSSDLAAEQSTVEEFMRVDMQKRPVSVLGIECGDSANADSGDVSGCAALFPDIPQCSD